MNLKESFRYQNYLDELFNKAIGYLNNRMYITSSVQEHMRSKANPEAADETIPVEVERGYSCTNDQLIDFVVRVIDERRQVALAIHRAKCLAYFACDAEVGINRSVQVAAKTFAMLGMLKGSERMTTGTSFKFNAEGNQVPYTYDVKVVTELAFDPVKAKAKSKELFGIADKVSADADRFLIETTVDHTPLFNVNEGFEDAVAVFLESIG